MARFVDDTIGPPMPPGTTPIPIPTPAPRAELVQAQVPGRGPPGYGHNMTLAALMARQKDLADAQNAQMQTGGGGTIMGGIGSLANIFVDALNERRTRKAEEEGNAEVADAWKSYDPATGMLSPEAMEVLMRRNPDAGQDLYKTAMALRASQAKQEEYQTLTADEAKALGLDATKTWQRSKLTNKIDQIGGGGITIGTGEKMTETLIKDTVFYPGARSAAMELEDIDTELTSLAGQTGSLLPGGNFLTSPEFQKARVAGDNWIQNVLRKESGAAIPTEELEKYRITYLPQPGDSPDTIAYKRQLRAQRTSDMRYGLEAGAPETLKKIDEEFDRRKAERDKRKADAGTTPPAEPDAAAPDAAAPDAAPAAPDAATPPAAAEAPAVVDSDTPPTGLKEGQEATDDQGKEWVVRNGKWVPKPRVVQ